MNGEDQEPVNADHQNMCKFDSRDDETYRKLEKRLNRMLKQGLSKKTETTNGMFSNTARLPIPDWEHSAQRKSIGREETRLLITQSSDNCCQRDQKPSMTQRG